MNKLRNILIVTALLLLSIGQPEQAALGQTGGNQYLCEYIPSGGGFNLICAPHRTPKPTRTQSATQTPTTEPSNTPTAMPSKTATSAPSATPTEHVHATNTPQVQTPAPSPTQPQQGNIQPYRNAPECPTHDETIWHGLWDFQRGCHYDHTHNEDPSLGDAVFGRLGALWNGNALAHLWKTSGETSNPHHAHSGFKVLVNMSPQPPKAQESWEFLIEQGNTVHYVSGFRCLYHGLGGNAHFASRFHSYFCDVQVTSRNGQVVGTISSGGHADFYCLHGEYKDYFIQVPEDPKSSTGQSVCGREHNIHEEPNRALSGTLDRLRSLSPSLDPNAFDNTVYWSTGGGHPDVQHNQLIDFEYRVLDQFGWHTDNVFEETFLCPDFSCRFNSTEHHIYDVRVYIPRSLDTDNDGIVNYTGYTDLKGNVVQGCSAPSATCIPLRIVNMPVGYAIWSRALSGERVGQGEVIEDFDVCFNGGNPVVCNGFNNSAGWVEFPN